MAGSRPRRAAPGKDFSLRSGERQFASELKDIRKDHVNRYVFGLDRIDRPGFGLDLFCGNGYGSHLAARRGHHVLGIDGSADAIAMANAHFQTGGTFFAERAWPLTLPAGRFDFCFCLESVEHVEDGAALVSQVAGALKPGGLLVLSTPNQDLMPFVPAQHKFHTRHYTARETFALVEDEGLEVDAWGGQDVYEIHEDGLHDAVHPDAPVVERTPGQFLILVARKP